MLEKAGKSWKVYAEDYPGGCFLDAARGNYVRKHVPFLSFKNVQTNPSRCAKIQDAAHLSNDISQGDLPDFSLYIPNLQNDGHDTGVRFADSWASRFVPWLLSNPKFTQDMLLILTFDESGPFGNNRIFTAISGDMVKSNVDLPELHSRLNHYNILRTIEDNFGLGTLGKSDSSAAAIEGIWK